MRGPLIELRKMVSNYGGRSFATQRGALVVAARGATAKKAASKMKNGAKRFIPNLPRTGIGDGATPSLMSFMT
jgi:hypothetical protein